MHVCTHDHQGIKIIRVKFNRVNCGFFWLVIILCNEVEKKSNEKLKQGKIILCSIITVWYKVLACNAQFIMFKSVELDNLLLFLWSN